MPDAPARPAPDEEWDDLLRQLRAQPPAQPRPYFYHRVHARLVAGAPAAASALPGWLRRPAYAVLLAGVVLALSGDGATFRPAAQEPQAAGLPRLLPR
ncbi:hypothetical protein [Hymenobacter sp. PAMC 26628]|uniref:hypothetical protein n=1 Tax=Hymenobacter sp. PAMC 26628 TaxID=1484118 RepID=UPI0007700E89|nr:hypothetical protein [Hymenobacter sp. PAMC 26628]AMJ64704.1 hypothetical protein AXW84_04110 [Hymenobacter sp. PAMC 26628]